MEAFKIGRETKTDVVIAYLSNIANPKIVDEVRERLNRIDVDSVICANNLNEVTTNLIGIIFEKDRNKLDIQIKAINDLDKKCYFKFGQIV